MANNTARGQEAPEERPHKRYITVKEAALLYSVSEDWLRRNKRIPKVRLGRRMVRLDDEALKTHFRNHTE
jgi:excisionase family DNA binding protein